MRLNTRKKRNYKINKNRKEDKRERGKEEERDEKRPAKREKFLVYGHSDRSEKNCKETKRQDKHTDRKKTNEIAV